MSCEGVRERCSDALARWADADARLNGIARGRLLGMKPKPMTSGSEEWETWIRGLDTCKALWEEYRRAELAYRIARLDHTDETPHAHRLRRPIRHRAA